LILSQADAGAFIKFSSITLRRGRRRRKRKRRKSSYFLLEKRK
jgi:hypothetical protein